MFARCLRETDVFLVGHPKSGNTWLAYMLAILLRRDREERVTLANVGEFLPYVHGRDYRIRRYEALPDPRIFRNEDPQYPDLYPRTIYLIRDPRAALVSLWHMYRTMFDAGELTFGRFLDQYMRSDGIFDWWNSNLVRWDHQVSRALDQSEDDPAVLVVSYEDLVRDRGRGMKRIAGFLELGDEDEALDLAVRRGAFDAMRNVEDRHGAEAYRGRARGEGKFVRVGRIDGWRDEISPELADRIGGEFGPVMRRAGYV